MSGTPASKTTDFEVARELHRQILGNRWFLPCGCVLKVTCRYPTKPWLHASGYFEICEYHEGNARRRRDGTLPRKIDHKLIGELNRRTNKWITEQGEPLPPLVLRAAFAEARQIKACRSEVATGLRARHLTQCVLAQEKTHVIKRDGSIYQL